MTARKILQFLLVSVITVGALGFGWLPSVSANGTKKTITQKITAQAREDIFLGRSGVFFPSSAYTGELTLTRTDPKSGSVAGLRFTEPFIEVSLSTDGKSEIKNVTGVVYIYFKLLSWERRMWDEGTVDIYQLDPKTGKWVICPNQQLVAGKNSPHGRLACVMTEFGTFAMATTR
jgi:hypothetical protein